MHFPTLEMTRGLEMTGRTGRQGNIKPGHPNLGIPALCIG